MSFPTTKLNIIIIALLAAIFAAGCVSNQPDLQENNLEYFLEQAQFHWEQRIDPEHAHSAKDFYAKAIASEAPDIELVARYSRACYFIGHYIETDNMKKDGIFLEGAEAAMDILYRSIIFQSLDDSAAINLQNNEISAITQVDEEFVPVLYWWVANFGRYLINKPVVERLKYSDLVQIALQKILEINPNYYYAGPYRLMGTFYARVPGNDMLQAKTIFEKSLEAYPNCFSTSVLMAQYSCTKAGNRKHFREILEKVINSDPTAIPDIIPENTFEQNFARQLLAMEFLLFE